MTATTMPRAETAVGGARRIVFVSWAASCSRSDHIARELGGSSHMVYAGWLGSSGWTVGLKYLLQFGRTLALLFRERPDAVFVMAPPLVAPAAALCYGAVTGTPFVIDAHTAAFLHPRWRRLQWLQRAISRRAATTIVTNEHLARRVEGGGASATIVRDVPVVFAERQPFDRSGRFTVAVVCSFNADEPIREIFEAASRVPDVDFRITGDPRALAPELALAKPANASLTGFLPVAAYGGLLAGADAVLTLTTRDHTMLRGAYEAIYQGTPVIVSDWPLLRQAFDEGALHVDNSPEAIAAAIRLMQASPGEYREGARRLGARKRDEWNSRRTALLRRIACENGRHPRT